MHDRLELLFIVSNKHGLYCTMAGGCGVYLVIKQLAVNRSSCHPFHTTFNYCGGSAKKICGGRLATDSGQATGTLVKMDCKILIVL